MAAQHEVIELLSSDEDDRFKRGRDDSNEDRQAKRIEVVDLFTSSPEPSQSDVSDESEDASEISEDSAHDAELESLASVEAAIEPSLAPGSGDETASLGSRSPEPGLPAPPTVHLKPSGNQITLKYTSTVPGTPSSGMFVQELTENFERFVESFSSDLDDIRLFIDGYEVQWYSTPKVAFFDSPISDEVEVEVSSKTRRIETPHPDADNLIQLKLSTPAGKLELNVKPDHTIQKIAEYVAKQKSIETAKITVEFDHDRVNFSDTIQELDIEDGDMLDVAW